MMVTTAVELMGAMSVRMAALIEGAHALAELAALLSDRPKKRRSVPLRSLVPPPPAAREGDFEGVDTPVERAPPGDVDGEGRRDNAGVGVRDLDGERVRERGEERVGERVTVRVRERDVGEGFSKTGEVEGRVDDVRFLMGVRVGDARRDGDACREGDAENTFVDIRRKMIKMKDISAGVVLFC